MTFRSHPLRRRKIAVTKGSPPQHPRKPAMTTVSISDLPEELLELIFTHKTDVLDLYKYSKVCHLWRSIIKNLLASPLVASLPPLLVAHKKQKIFIDNQKSSKIDRVDLFSIVTKNSIACEIPKFKTHDEQSYVPKKVFSSRGWLIVTYYTTPDCCYIRQKHKHDIYLYNPLSRVGFWLPSLPCSEPKFILSSKGIDPSFMVLAHNSFYCDKYLVFWKLGDKKWTSVLLYDGIEIKDIIHYKSEFYAIDKKGTFSQIEFTPFPRAKAIPMKLNKSVERELVERPPLYLVESSSGDLWMVLRNLQTLDLVTYKFMVYKLDWERNKWDTIKNLGDEAIFLGHNDSMCIRAIGSIGCKQNCIYFTNDSWDGDFSNYVKEFGIYDMGNQIINRGPNFFPNHDNPYYRWFRPDVTDGKLQEHQPELLEDLTVKELQEEHELSTEARRRSSRVIKRPRALEHFVTNY